MAGGLNFRVYEVERLHLVAKPKAQLCLGIETLSIVFIDFPHAREENLNQLNDQFK